MGSGDERRGVVSFRLAVVNNKVYSLEDSSQQLRQLNWTIPAGFSTRQ